jgi:NAD(P)-dependent dehydrogenase (short-subunit alcohol dehydrogenase family)
VRNSALCDDGIQRIEDQLGPIDGLVAAAGISVPALAATMDDEIWLRAIDVNLNGRFGPCVRSTAG